MQGEREVSETGDRITIDGSYLEAVARTKGHGKWMSEMQFRQEIPEEQSRCPVNRFGAKRPMRPKSPVARAFVDAAITRAAYRILGLKPPAEESAEFRVGFLAGLRAAALALRFDLERDGEKGEDDK